MRAAILVLILAGCAAGPLDLCIDPHAAAKNSIQGYLEMHLEACVDGDHACRCHWVENARAECIWLGMEQHCADDYTERSRGEPGCKDYEGGNTYIRRYPMRRTAVGSEFDNQCDRK